MFNFKSVFFVILFLGTTPLYSNQIEDKAMLHYENGKYQEALIYISKNLPKAEDKNLLNLLLSKVLVINIETEKAFSCYNQLLTDSISNYRQELVLDHVEELLDIASIFRQNGMYGIAELLVSEAQRNNSEYSSIYYDKASIYVSRGQLTDFLDSFYKGFKLNPRNPKRFSGLAVLNSFDDKRKSEVFYWLKAASFSYQNPILWSNAIKEFEKHGITSEDKVSEYVKNISDRTRKIFYYYYYTHRNNLTKAHEAVEFVRNIRFSELTKVSDYKYFLFCSNLYFNENFTAGDQFSSVPSAFQNNKVTKLYNSLFWIRYWNSHQWTSETIRHHREFLENLISYLTAKLSDQHIQVVNNQIINWLVISFCEKGYEQKAIKLLKDNALTLDLNNRYILAGLYLNEGNIKDSVQVMEKIYHDFPDAPNIAKNILEYDILLRNHRLLERHIAMLHDKQQFIQYSQYIDKFKAVSFKKKVPDKRTISMPGAFSLSLGDTSDWMQWKPLGPCAFNMIYSIRSIWENEKPDYSSIKESLLDEEKFSSDSIKQLAHYFEAHNYNLYTIVPLVDSVKMLIDNNIPVAILWIKTFKGISFGHVTVVYGYDDLQKRFFQKDSLSQIGESTINYSDLFEARYAIMIVPKSKKDKSLLRKLLIFSELGEYKPSDFDKKGLVFGCPDMSTWFNIHEGTRLFKLKNPECIEYFEKVLNSKKLNSSFVYEYLAKAFCSQGEYAKAMDIIDRGIMIYSSLDLMKLKIEILLKEKVITKKRSEQLLGITAKMEKINPDYPDIYLYRGEIYTNYLKEYELAINAFRDYLKAFVKMNLNWQNEQRSRPAKVKKIIEYLKNQINSTKGS